MNDFDTFKKLTKIVGDLGKIIVVKCFEWLHKVQKIAQSGHTDYQTILKSADKSKLNLVSIRLEGSESGKLSRSSSKMKSICVYASKKANFKSDWHVINI